MNLECQLDQIKGALRQGRFTSEAAVSQGIVLPTLHALGWPVFDTSIVVPEYSVESRRVDFALCHPANRPAVFVEVKRVGFSEGADRQLFEYAFHIGVPMAVLTDGQEWSFYLPGERGLYEERRVYKIDLLEREVSEASERLRRYLGYERTSSGEALKAARSDYKNVARDREISEALPKAWKTLLEEQDSILLELLAEKVEDICGYKPDIEACGHFVEAVQSPPFGGANAKPHTCPPDTRRPEYHQERRPTRQRRNTYGFSFRGTQYKAGSAQEVMAQIFKLFHEADTEFLEHFTARKHGRKRRYLARDKIELYPGRLDLVKHYSIEIVPGWWMGTNYSRRDIQKIIDLGREVAGPELGGTLDASVQ